MTFVELCVLRGLWFGPEVCLRKVLASGVPTFYVLPLANAGMFTLASTLKADLPGW
jgi:hypothetical protein